MKRNRWEQDEMPHVVIAPLQGPPHEGSNPAQRGWILEGVRGGQSAF
jgi:hypothetical protein